MHSPGLKDVRRGAGRDAILYGASAVHALMISLFPVHSIYRAWGRMAVWPYALAGAASVGVRLIRSAPRIGRARVGLALLVLAGAGLVPMAYQVGRRAATDPSRHAQSHTIISEEAAGKLLDGDNPYAADYRDGPLASWDLGVATHFPYMPAMTLFGLPRALDGRNPAADARVFFAAAGLGVFGAAAMLWKTTGDRRLLALQVLAILPTGAIFLSGGAHELPPLALMFLSLILLGRGRVIGAGLALGSAAAIKQTAWLLVPFLVAAAYRQKGRAAAMKMAVWFSMVLIPVTLPFVLLDLGAFIEDTMRFPLDIGTHETIARGPTIGRMLAATFPSAKEWISLGLLGVVVLFIVFLLSRRTPADAGGASLQAGVVFTAAIFLSTAGRPGYILYPINLLLWGWLLRRSGAATVTPTIAVSRGARTILPM